MTKREMISLLIKLMGVYALVQLVPGVVQAIGMFTTSIIQLKDRPSQMAFILMVMMFFSPLVWIGLCLWVIRKSDRFAKRLYPVDAPAGQLTTLGVEDIQRLGYNFIGLLLIVRSLPQLLMILYQCVMLYRLPYEQRYQNMSACNTQWIMLAIQLAIGLYLFLRPKGLANLWARIQGKVPDYVCSEPHENKKE